MTTTPEQVTIQFNPTLYSKLPKDLISRHFEFLIKTFKLDYKKYFPTSVTNESDLLFLIHLSRSLERLKDCDGFADHIKEFKNGIESTYFVTIIADYLITQSSKLSLEPTSDGLQKKADILATINGQDIYFECKNPQHDILSPIEKEHEEMYAALHSSVNKPCDVSITYQDTLTTKQLSDLGDFLKAKLPLVTGEGKILNYEGVKVEVTNVREQFTNIGDIRITRLWDNYQEKALHPGSIINRNGIAMMFFKTGVTAFKNIESQIRNSKNKVPKDKPLIAVIHAEGIPGKLIDNIEFVNSLFNENKYTSFNGVLFVRHCYTFQRLIEYQFHYVNNPFARNQLSQLSQLFKSTMTD
jgi:hypothetical protein